MLRTIVFSAFGAALLVCVAVSALQFMTTEPLILQAEAFEGSTAHNHGTVSNGITAPDDHAHDAEDWAPAGRIERGAYTALANLVVAFAVSLMLLGAMTLKGDTINAGRGFLWGIAGFFSLSLLPSLGLPPELPGTPAADIVTRQVWWLGTAAASVAGIALLAFGRHWTAKAAGVALLVAPHAVGAPAPPSHDVAYPGALTGEFVVASLVVSAILWSLSGVAAGWLHQRLSGNA
jgi:cobalt transporter subunit CbtA